MRRLPKVPASGRDFALATLPDGHIFIIGGRSGTGPGAELITGDTAVLEFDPFANEVRRQQLGRLHAASLARRRRGADGERRAHLRDRRLRHDQSGVNPVALVEEYNPSTDTWTQDTSLPSVLAPVRRLLRRRALNAAEPDDLIFVLGGNTVPRRRRWSAARR
jgi:hypothetical protein